MSGSMGMISARRSREGIPEIRRNLDAEIGTARLSSATVARPVQRVPGTYIGEFLSEFLSPKKVCHMRSIRKINNIPLLHGSQYLIFHESLEKYKILCAMNNRKV